MARDEINKDNNILRTPQYMRSKKNNVQYHYPWLIIPSYSYIILLPQLGLQKDPSQFAN